MKKATRVCVFSCVGVEGLAFQWDGQQRPHWESDTWASPDKGKRNDWVSGREAPQAEWTSLKAPGKSKSDTMFDWLLNGLYSVTTKVTAKDVWPAPF